MSRQMHMTAIDEAIVEPAAKHRFTANVLIKCEMCFLYVQFENDSGRMNNGKKVFFQFPLHT